MRPEPNPVVIPPSNPSVGPGSSGMVQVATMMVPIPAAAGPRAFESGWYMNMWNCLGNRAAANSTALKVMVDEMYTAGGSTDAASELRKDAAIPRNIR